MASAPLISVIIPTIPGREAHLVRCKAAYERWGGGSLELLIEFGHPTCGHAWAAGGARAKGAYLHFSADDLEPLEGWWEPALKACAAGWLPCPRIFTPGGGIESCGQWGQLLPDGTLTNIARIPFLTREWWNEGAWVLKQHYYTDNWVWQRGQQLGLETRVCWGYDFIHHWASEGRLDTIDSDLRLYQEAGGGFG